MSHSNQRNSPILWLLKPGIKPCLPYEDFTKRQTPLSRALYNVLNRHFSLMANSSGGSVVEAFDRFDKSSRDLKGIEASPILLRQYPQHDIFVANIKGRKKETVAKVLAAIEQNPDVKKLLSAPDLSAVWATANTPENSIVGGFDQENQFMVLFGRRALDGAKSIFNFPENPGRYKPRAERAPAFMSSGHVAISVVEYPQQVDKAIAQLVGFKQTCPHNAPQTYCLASYRVGGENSPELARLHQSGIEVIHHAYANGLIQEAKRTLDRMLHTKPAARIIKEPERPLEAPAYS